MGSWQWGYKDNDMWLLGFLRCETGTGDMTQPWGDHFQHSKAMFDFVHKTNMHQPPSSGGKLCMNYFKENKFQSPLEAQINGWICVLALSKSKPWNASDAEMLFVTPGMVCPRFVGWNHLPIHVAWIHICSTTQQSYTGLEASETGMKETQIHTLIIIWDASSLP